MQNLRFSSLQSFQKILSNIPLDQDKNIYFFSRVEFLKILDQFLRKRIWYEDLIDLMNILESKDGIIFDDDIMKESIHSLANIDIQGFDIFNLISKIKES